MSTEPHRQCEARPGRPGRSAPALTVVICLVAAVSVSGCLSGPPPVLTDYTLSYPEPELPGLEPLPVELSVELRGANDLLSKTDMLYQQGSFSFNAYVYDRWAAAPVDLARAFLVRDLHGSGLFTGVYDYRENLRTRYLLEGILAEFHEVDGEESGRARLRLRLSLLDVGDGGRRQRLLFQRTYTADGPEEPKNAAGLAASMSEALRGVSRELVSDVHAALQQTTAGR